MVVHQRTAFKASLFMTADEPGPARSTQEPANRKGKRLCLALTRSPPQINNRFYNAYSRLQYVLLLLVMHDHTKRRAASISKQPSTGFLSFLPMTPLNLSPPFDLRRNTLSIFQKRGNIRLASARPTNVMR